MRLPKAWRAIRLVAPLAVVSLVLAACSLTTGTTEGTPVPSITPGGPTLPPGSGLGAHLYSPDQVRAAYGVQSLYEKGFTGKGQTVVLIESFGAPNIVSDTAHFSTYFHLPPAQITVVSPLGTNNVATCSSDTPGWAGETTEDVAIIHAIAPDAKIVILTSPVDETEGVAGLPEFRQLEQYAVDHQLGNIISQSFGASEISLSDAAGQAEVAKWASFYQDATTNKHMTFIASSGDGGAADYANADDACNQRLASKRSTSFPADVPWVSGIGGTQLNITSTSVGESAWNDNLGGASGGGFSTFFSQPDFQKTLPAGVQSQFGGKRGVPDVSSSADETRGLAMFFQGNWQPVSGTSAGAPMWSALMAIANQMAGHPLGFINPALYKIGTSDKAAADFRDITQGNNGQPQVGVSGFDAVPGWDAVTGFGSPIADKLLPDLIAAIG
jgi:subtilase family serine protease